MKTPALVLIWTVFTLVASTSARASTVNPCAYAYPETAHLVAQTLYVQPIGKNFLILTDAADRSKPVGLCRYFGNAGNAPFYSPLSETHETKSGASVGNCAAWKATETKYLGRDGVAVVVESRLPSADSVKALCPRSDGTPEAKETLTVGECGEKSGCHFYPVAATDPAASDRHRVAQRSR